MTSASDDLASALAANVDQGRLWQDIEELARFRDEGTTPYTRRAFGPAYEPARAWLRRRMEDAGLETRRDEAGTLIGTWAGSDTGLPLVAGSHIDTVEGGGRFDGVLGVVAALEAARVLAEADHRLAHPLEVVDFTAEEPNGYGSSCIGSRAWVGALEERMLEQTDESGEPLAIALARAGAVVDRLADARRPPGSIAAYVELHIEQGPVLERHARDVGVVTGIVGIRRMRAQLVGVAAHAGTTPMDDRHDALASAAELALSIERVGREAAGELVATAGRVLVEPNAPNVIPGSAEVAFEVRSLDERRLDDALRLIADAGRSAAASRGVELRLEELLRIDAVPADPRVVAALERGAQLAGASAMAMPSWGGHDASQIAAIAPTGMLFAPSKAGVSHHADEWTSPEQCAVAARALLAALVSLDASLAPNR